MKINTSFLEPCLSILRRHGPTPSATALAAADASASALRAATSGQELVHPPLDFGLVFADRHAEDLLRMSDDELWELRRSCARFGLLCFRGMAGMTAERFGQFMGRWGAIERDYDVLADGSLDPTAPADVAPAVFGNGGPGEHLYADPSWHFDGEDLAHLHSYTSLFCLRPPHVGHSTAFAATSVAAAHLPAELLARLDGAQAEYSSLDIGNVEVLHDDNGPQLKPILRQHKHFHDELPPALQLYGGRKRIILSDGTVLPEADALVLGDALAEYATQPAFQCALEWEEDSLAIWDNQTCQHAVVPYDYTSQTRKMWRMTIGEDEPPLPPAVLAAVTDGGGGGGSASNSKARL
jgi:alpha-ketoglutarate-dependent taurine dioxygenase